MANSLQKTKTKQQPFSVAIQTDTYKNLINHTLGDPKKAEKFVASISSAVAINPDLKECEAGTILASGLLGESLNLSPSPQLGQYYLVPYNDRKNNRVTCTFQLGYRGLIQLAIRTNSYKDIDALDVREGEFIGRDKATGKPLFEFIEDEVSRQSKKIIGYRAYFERLNGFTKVLYMSNEALIAHAIRYSHIDGDVLQTVVNGGSLPEKDKWKYSSPWYTSFDKMASKTVLKQLLNVYGEFSTEMVEAISKDQAQINVDGTYEYVGKDDEEEILEEDVVEVESAEDVDILG